MTAKQNFLFEILTEELPPKALIHLENAFINKVIEGIKQVELGFSHYQSFATPRRLAFIITELDYAQSDREIEKRGPALSAAYDPQGQPTKATLGFLNAYDITLDQVQTLKTDKGEWLYYKIKQSGKTVHDLLPELIHKALMQLPVPKMMKWGMGKYDFIRPVHNIVMLYGQTVIKAELFGIKATHQTYGHRFHHPQALAVTPENYVEQLRQAYVIANYQERSALIAKQISKAAESKKAQANYKPALLEEVTSLVEWPVVLIGSFEPRFLEVPKEALILSMESNQRYFPLTDKQDHLLPFFVLISNIDSKNPEQVIAGNEKVTRARLSDAEFFFNADKKVKLASHIESLGNIIFQKELGTLLNKSNRLIHLSGALAKLLDYDLSTCQRAAELSKADLLTAMVGEFPELQGIMGRYYAVHDGELLEVALAIDEQYQPRFAKDKLPTSRAGQVLAIADKLDTLVGIFGINKIPSGEKDPLGLRRATLGILRIILEKQLPLDLKELISLAYKGYQNKLPNLETESQVLDFFQERLKFWARSEGFRADVFEAVAARQVTSPLDFIHRLDAVNEFLKLPEALHLATANKRVHNILSKHEQEIVRDQLDSSLLKDPAEIALAHKIKQKSEQLSQLNYQQALKNLAELNAPIDQFFTEVMVMVEDKKIRANRLALLKQLRQLFLQVADISLLQGQ